MYKPKCIFTVSVCREHSLVPFLVDAFFHYKYFYFFKFILICILGCMARVHVVLKSANIRVAKLHTQWLCFLDPLL